MTLTPEEEAELEAMLETTAESAGEEREESTPPETPPKESLPTTEELEQEAAAKKEAQKTLAGEDADPKKMKNSRKQKSEEDLELEHTILERLGFQRHDDREEGKGLKYKINLPPAVWSEIVRKTYEARSEASDTGFDGITIIRNYSDKYQNGRFSAAPYIVEGRRREYPKNEKDNPSWLTSEEYCSLRPVKQFYHYRDKVPDQPLPPAIVIGKLVDIRGGGSCIQIEGQGENQIIMYPTSLIMKDKDRVYSIPANLSIADNQGNLRMNIPREIKLPNYETEKADIEKRQASEPERTKKKEEQPEYVPDEVTEKERDKKVAGTNENADFDWMAEMQESAEHYRLAFKAAEKIVEAENIAYEYQLSRLALLQFTHEIAKDINYNTEKRWRTPLKGTGRY